MKESIYKLINFYLCATIIISLYVLSTYYFFRLDLTEEKKYTLTDATRKILSQLKGDFFVEVYLSGDLPPGFDRLKKSTKNMLDQFAAYTNANIHYAFIDPHESKTEQEKATYFTQLAKKGLQPTNLYINDDGKQIEKMVFPGAIITYASKEQAVSLLQGSSAASPTEILNQSVEGVEYTLISALKKLAFPGNLRIGFVEGHGELTNVQLDDFARSIKDNFIVERVSLTQTKNLHHYYDLLIIAKPTLRFTEDEKLILDQYVIKGGKLMLFIDKTTANPHAFSNGSQIVTPVDCNLDDFLFKCGVRANSDLVQDLQCSALPMVVGTLGEKPQIQLIPWLYYPVVSNFGNHVSVKNSPAVWLRYAGSLDTIKSAGIKKTLLIQSSPYSKTMQIPANLKLEVPKEAMHPEKFKNGSKTLGVLLEGRFKSMYTHRLSDGKKKEIDFEASDKNSKIMVFSDGDMIANDVTPDGSQVFPLGFDRYTKKRFSNKEVLMNCIDYMTQEEGIIQARNKSIKLRPLDKQKIKKEKKYWQTLNLVLPVFILILFGYVYHRLRQKKYAT